MSKSLTKVLACKVDADLDSAVRRVARRQAASVSAFVRRALVAEVERFRRY